MEGVRDLEGSTVPLCRTGVHAKMQGMMWPQVTVTRSHPIIDVKPLSSWHKIVGACVGPAVDEAATHTVRVIALKADGLGGPVVIEKGECEHTACWPQAGSLGTGNF
jgi:hypothetical protein